MLSPMEVTKVKSLSNSRLGSLQPASGTLLAQRTREVGDKVTRNSIIALIIKKLQDNDL